MNKLERSADATINVTLDILFPITIAIAVLDFLYMVVGWVGIGIIGFVVTSLVVAMCMVGGRCSGETEQ